ncbi:hypothetical protein [Moorella sulfitireducens (nom. illeg.)]|uniref:hypothetical protein n=1 Tax=Neomoorella sulfitireducens TaxID=2972948 RepID=UPI0021AC27F6|nr:hypothetical protein [Moorella sulfitireducens]
MISFICADGIYPESRALLILALKDMAEKNVNFVDAYLAALAGNQEEAICSFEVDFQKLGVKWVAPPGYM